MGPADLPPVFWFWLGALVLALGRPQVRAGVLLATPLISLWLFGGMELGTTWTTTVLGMEITPFRLDEMGRMFGVLFHIAAFLAGLYSLHVPRTGEHSASLLYAGAALGAVCAGDLISLFVFWEIMAVASTVLIWSRGSDRSWRAGQRYLLQQMVSGLVLLAGAVIHYSETGSLAITDFGTEAPGGWLILIGLGIKAAWPLAHTWLTDGYPEATPTGTVWLSAFTTKASVCLIARMFPGTPELIWIGALMAAFPIFYAVIENDLRRVLGYSMVNQIGFMMVGIGIGTDLALNGAVAHAFNDVLFKGLLFMTMGAVLQQTGKIGGSELGGLHKTMPWTSRFCMVGAASISAFPLFSGFVSKAMVMTACLEEHQYFVWFVLLFAAAGVFHHAGIKIPFFAFYAHDAGLEAKDPPRNMLAAMALGSIGCIAIGCFPHHTVYALLPYGFSKGEFAYLPYDQTHILTQTQLLFFSALAFVWLQRTGRYPPELPSTNLDADWIWRRMGPRVWAGVSAPVGAVWRGGARAVRYWVQSLDDSLRAQRGPTGKFERTWPTGAMMLWIAVLLVGYLLLYYRY